MVKIIPFRFSRFSNAPSEAPDVSSTYIPLVERFANGEKLTRAEKNRIAEDMYLFRNDACYKWLGWLWDSRPFLNRYLVKMSDESLTNVWREYYAPDKTALRKGLRYTGKIQEIVGPITNHLSAK